MGSRWLVACAAACRSRRAIAGIAKRATNIGAGGVVREGVRPDSKRQPAAIEWTASQSSEILPLAPLHRPSARSGATSLGTCLVTATPAIAQQQEVVDTATLNRLYAEATTNGQVMSLASWLTDVHGSRLTGSPGAKAAGEWAVQTINLKADARRLGDEELNKLAGDAVPDPRSGGFAIPRDPAPLATMMRRFGGTAFRPLNHTAALRWMEREGEVAILMPARGDDGTIFTDNGYPRTAAIAQVPMVHVQGAHYDRIARILEKGVPVTLSLDMANTTTPEAESFNIVAETPGSDPALRDEVVMLGAHFDSWHAGTGATDNAAGSAVMMEAIRLIKASGLKPRRTIRIGLWTGEEQGLFGSREYVARHLGERVFHTDSAGFTATDTVRALPDYVKNAGHFNVDNGTGRIRGIYLQGNTQLRDAFSAWIVVPDKQSKPIS